MTLFTGSSGSSTIARDRLEPPQPEDKWRDVPHAPMPRLFRELQVRGIFFCPYGRRPGQHRRGHRTMVQQQRHVQRQAAIATTGTRLRSAPSVCDAQLRKQKIDCRGRRRRRGDTPWSIPRCRQQASTEGEPSGKGLFDGLPRWWPPCCLGNDGMESSMTGRGGRCKEDAHVPPSQDPLRCAAMARPSGSCERSPPVPRPKRRPNGRFKALFFHQSDMKPVVQNKRSHSQEDPLPSRSFPSPLC